MIESSFSPAYALELIYLQRKNCVGYVYYRLGLRGLDRYADPGTIEEKLTIFDKVEDSRPGDVVCLYREGTREIVHMACVDEDVNFVVQRGGINRPIERLSLSDMIQSYLVYGFRSVFLRLKPNSERLRKT